VRKRSDHGPSLYNLDIAVRYSNRSISFFFYSKHKF
jgi:hypothetical protein